MSIYRLSASHKSLKTNKRRTIITLLSLVVIFGTSTVIVFATHTKKLTTKTITPATLIATKAVSQNSNPLSDLVLFVDRTSSAAQQVQLSQKINPQQAAAMNKLAVLPTPHWLTSDKSLMTLSSYLGAAHNAKAAAILVVYNAPFRDCGRYSANNLSSENDYKSFIDTLSKTLTSDPVIIILEPDAIAGLDKITADNKACLDISQKQSVLNSLHYATTKLKALTGVKLYIDAGNSGWAQDMSHMINYLKQAGIENVDGFSVNVSNFQTTENSLAYGSTLSAQLGGKHFIIDSSRNGLGPYKNPTYPDYAWCNPPARALGHYPTTATGIALADAYLYIKIPGESDGQDDNAQKCFNGPSAGTWWPEYAQGLVERWPKELQQ